MIEQDGELRPANLAEVKQTSWKPVRHIQEHTYAGAKQGWLDRTVRSKSNAWGKKDILEGGKMAAADEKDEIAATSQGEEEIIAVMDENDVEELSSSSDSSDGESGESSSSDSSEEEEGDGDDSEPDEEEETNEDGEEEKNPSNDKKE